MHNLETIISFCKRRGFMYQTADIYGGINGVYDAGHLGSLMLKNIRSSWLEAVSNQPHQVLLFEGALLGPQAVWKASGHLDNFHDPMVDCLACKHRYRADEINLEKSCPHCGKKSWTDVKEFNMMFDTSIGASTDNAIKAYLRPETAQAIFVQFKNIYSTNRVKLPFGVAQIGKSFRNEINPQHFLFRVREFEQMELEWFCKPDQSDEFFNYWCQQRFNWYHSLGVNPQKIRLRSYEKSELAHYSQATSDIEYEFPFGWKELEGIAHRGAFDLTQHSTHAGKDLAVYDEATKQSYIPHVVEASVGVGRLFLTLIIDAYHEQELEDEKRIVLKLSPRIAPITAAILPLTKEHNEQAEILYKNLLKEKFSVVIDESGSIGKRYRRQDEIGTPLCITYDFESSTHQSVTVRNRDTMQQERISIDALSTYIRDMLAR
jgi:glycyl-tRNA synthetase